MRSNPDGSARAFSYALRSWQSRSRVGGSRRVPQRLRILSSSRPKDTISIVPLRTDALTSESSGEAHVNDGERFTSKSYCRS